MNDHWLQMSTDELIEKGHHLTTDEITQFTPQASKEQLLGLTVGINERHDAAWKEKTHSLIAATINRPQLETIGTVLTPTQFLSVVDVNGEEHRLLPPLVVGMHHRDFLRVITKATPKQLETLKHEGLTEPLQFQLRLLFKAWIKEIDKQCTGAMALEKEITQLNVTALTKEKLTLIEERLTTIHTALEQTLADIQKALSLAWHTNRLELIEKYGSLKEIGNKTLHLILGDPHPPTGLYLVLTNQLNTIFAKDGVDTLTDDDPALEALSRFSVWYLEDYWKLGLLPSVSDPTNLKTQNYTEAELEAFTEEIKHSLNALGLTTVRDFKARKIYSRPLLEAFFHET
ncbi:MAG: hypothetical protein KDK65_02900 [Chlamydiia bacterium]|nr:hypothetical protein [Chlamydiia bacterium]